MLAHSSELFTLPHLHFRPVKNGLHLESNEITLEILTHEEARVNDELAF